MTAPAVPVPSGVRWSSSQLPTLARRLRRSRSGTISLAFLVLLVLVAVLCPLISPHDPLAQASKPLQPPSLSYPFGTDELGRDILSRMMYGTRSALLVALGSAFLSAVIGVPLGIISGYFRGWVDYLIMRVLDVFLAIPSLLLALVVITMLGSGSVNLVLAISVAAAPVFARLTRASTLMVRESEYVLAARTMGASHRDIMMRTVLPNVTGPVIVQLIITASLAIYTSAGLNFLGLGQAPPAPTWGGMLQTARSFLFHSTWYGVFPGLILFATIAAFTGLGRALDRGDQTSTRADIGTIA